MARNVSAMMISQDAVYATKGNRVIEHMKEVDQNGLFLTEGGDEMLTCYPTSLFPSPDVKNVVCNDAANPTHLFYVDLVKGKNVGHWAMKDSIVAITPDKVST
jgi:hypothetical protein